MNTMKISIAAEDDLDTVVTLVTELLGELGAEGREFAGADRTALESALGEGAHIRPVRRPSGPRRQR